MRLAPILMLAALVAPAYGQTDPFLKYAKDIGRAEFNLTTTDAAGDVIAVGRTASSLFAVTPGALQPRFGGGVCASRGEPCYDVVIAKFRASDGVLAAATFLGGNGDDLPTAVTADAQGFIYIAGTTTSRNFPVTEGAVQSTNRSSTSTGFLTKVHTSLTGAVYSTYVGGNAPTRITSVAADRQGNASVAGSTDAADFPRTPGAFRSTGPVPQAFFAKVHNSGGSFMGSTFLGAGTPEAIAVDADGHAWIAGTTSADWPITPGAYQTTRRGSADLFLTRVAGNGTSLLYSTYIGGSSNDQAVDMKLDGAGNIYVGGVTYSAAFPGTTETLGEVGTGFILKFAGQTVAWTHPLRANGVTAVNAIHLDGEQVMGTGITISTHFPTTPGAYRRCVAAGSSTLQTPFFLRLSAGDGKLVYSTLLHENITAEKWAVFLRDGGDIVTVNRRPPVFEPVPPTDIRRYSFTAESMAAASPRLECAVSAGSYRNSGMTPGLVVTLFGSGMGPKEGVVPELVDGKVPTSVAGVRVLFNGVPAPLLYVREDQINAVVPFAVANATSATVRVEYGTASIPALTLNVKPADAGVFRLGSTEFGAILNEDGSVNSTANPAARGTVVTFWATGMGPFESPYEDGSIVGENYSGLITPARVSVGGFEGQVLYSGSAPGMVAGVAQVNLRLATNTRVSSRLPISIRLGDSTFSEVAYISVK